MAHTFKIIPAKPTFGQLRTNAYSFQSDYITLKKSRLAYCNTPNKCLGSKRNGYNYLVNNKLVSFNKTGLVAGLYSKMDLKNVCTLINGFPCSNIDSCSACLSAASIDTESTVPLNWTNTVDPVGALFGNTPCGIENFTDYMKFGC